MSGTNADGNGAGAPPAIACALVNFTTSNAGRLSPDGVDGRF